MILKYLIKGGGEVSRSYNLLETNLNSTLGKNDEDNLNFTKKMGIETWFGINNMVIRLMICPALV